MKPAFENQADRSAFICIAWRVFAAALIYLYAVELWLVHYHPAHVAGSRMSFGAWTYFALLSELIIIVIPIVLLFSKWSLAITTGILTGIYFFVSYEFF